MTAESQVVCHSVCYITILRFDKSVIEIHLAFRFLGTCRNVYIRILDCLNASDELDAACTAQSKTLEDLTLDELKAASDLFEQDVYEAINLENCMALRASYGGPAVSETTRQIEAIEAFVTARNN